MGNLWMTSAKRSDVPKKTTSMSNTGLGASRKDIKILLADDHRILREGLLHMFRNEEGIRVLGEVEDGKKLLQMVKELNPDVLIVEPGLPGAEGPETVKEILAHSPKTKIIALSMCKDSASVVGMMRAGSSGYLLKDCSFEELLNAVRMVGGGHTYMSHGIMGIVVKEYVSRMSPPDKRDSSALTQRESEVLRLIAEGKRTKDIASDLGVSSKTIESHRRQIMKKLNLTSIAALVKYAIREGLASM
jgi:two-component system, NarL family, response regulator NreC